MKYIFLLLLLAPYSIFATGFGTFTTSLNYSHGQQLPPTPAQYQIDLPPPPGNPAPHGAPPEGTPPPPYVNSIVVIVPGEAPPPPYESSQAITAPKGLSYLLCCCFISSSNEISGAVGPGAMRHR